MTMNIYLTYVDLYDWLEHRKFLRRHSIARAVEHSHCPGNNDHF